MNFFRITSCEIPLWASKSSSVSRDKKLVYRNDTTRQRIWTEPETSTKLGKHQPYALKVLSCLFWTFEGPFNHELLKRRDSQQTATSLNFHGWWLHFSRTHLFWKKGHSIPLHCNALPHTATKKTNSFITQLDLEIHPRLFYSLYLAPMDYHVFRCLHHFLTNNKVNAREKDENAIEHN